MGTKQITPIEAKVKEFLTKKAKLDKGKKELDQLKESILSEVETLNFQDGVCELATGVLKEAANPPKMLKANGEPMEAVERARLAELLDPRYIVKDVNFKLLIENLDSDTKLRKILKINKAEIKQGTRVDIKPLK